jgi:hypothetical protein
MVRLVTEAQKAYADVVRDLEKAQEQLKAAKFELGKVTESTCTSVPDPGLVQKPDTVLKEEHKEKLISVYQKVFHPLMDLFNLVSGAKIADERERRLISIYQGIYSPIVNLYNFISNQSDLVTIR